MAVQTIQLTSRLGISLTTLAVAADAGLTDVWANTGDQLVYIENNSGGSINVTLNWGTNASVDGQTPTARVVAVAAGAKIVIGPFPVANYNNTSTNQASVTYSAVTTVKICVFQKGT